MLTKDTLTEVPFMLKRRERSGKWKIGSENYSELA